MSLSAPDCVLGDISVGSPEAERPGGEGIPWHNVMTNIVKLLGLGIEMGREMEPHSQETTE